MLITSSVSPSWSNVASGFLSAPLVPVKPLCTLLDLRDT